MASKHNLLRYGDEDEVAALVDEYQLDEGEVRAVLLNLLQAIGRQEKARAKLEVRLAKLEKLEVQLANLEYAVGLLESGVKP